MRSGQLTRPSDLARRIRRRRKKATAVRVAAGFVLLFTLSTMLFLLLSAPKSSGGKSAKKPESSAPGSADFFEAYLGPIVALDPKPFADLTKADPAWMLKAAVWAASQSEARGSRKFTSEHSPREILPASDVITAYHTYFGKDTAPLLRTFTDQGTMYEYNSKAAAFYVPIRGISSVYTPKVTQISIEKNETTLTVDYLPGTGWKQKSDGTIVRPAPAKVMKYTLRSGSYSIVSILSIY